MKEEILQAIRNEYKEKIIARSEVERELDKLRADVRIRQTHPAVCNFFEAIEKYMEKEKLYESLFDTNLNTLSQIANQYSSFGYISDTNKILFYRGSFYAKHSKENKGVVTQCLRYDSVAEYDLYIDIESLERIKNPVENRENFEKNNDVLVFGAFPSKDDFYKIRTAFFKVAIDQGQEEAVRRVLNRK